jgi:hypothetical protein
VTAAAAAQLWRDYHARIYSITDECFARYDEPTANRVLFAYAAAPEYTADMHAAMRDEGLEPPADRIERCFAPLRRALRGTAA